MIYDPCEECDPMPPKQYATDTKSYRTEVITCSNCKFGKAKEKIKELKKYIRQLPLSGSGETPSPKVAEQPSDNGKRCTKFYSQEIKDDLR